jgi:cysteinyl-tRNA synthetase
MKIYNTLSAKKEEFKPLKKNHVGMYVCGPTVYDFGHVGHGRGAVTFDIIRKYLIYKGYDVTFVMNFTDIDDKVIQRAELMKMTESQLTEMILPGYKKDYAALGVMPPDVQPKATEHIAEMITIIEGLEEKGYTYRLDDGIYYDISKFKDYGKLSKQKMDELRSGIRVILNEEKRNPQDFVLWKFSKPGEPKWESPWGEGRPGWHIECSAMSSKYLGESFDIHGGGADLIFPHHECEIAQSEGLFQKPFVKYWLHNGFIQVNHEKMSKSLGNFYTLKDIFEKYSPQVVRFLYLQTHYRAPIEFSVEIVEQSKNGLERVQDFMKRLQNYIPHVKNTAQADINESVNNTIKDFESAMDDDFETPRVLSAIFELIKTINKRMDTDDLTRESKEMIMTNLLRLDAILGIFVPTRTENIDDEIQRLISDREAARKNRDFKKADEIRQTLLDKGIQLEDTPKGTEWKRI